LIKIALFVNRFSRIQVKEGLTTENYSAYNIFFI